MKGRNDVTYIIILLLMWLFDDISPVDIFLLISLSRIISLIEEVVHRVINTKYHNL